MNYVMDDSRELNLLGNIHEVGFRVELGGRVEITSVNGQLPSNVRPFLLSMLEIELNEELQQEASDRAGAMTGEDYEWR
jgi:hypothetical protein